MGGFEGAFYGILSIFIIIFAIIAMAFKGEEKVEIQTGEAVLWAKGEGHVYGSSKGLSAVVIQSEKLLNGV